VLSELGRFPIVLSSHKSYVELEMLHSSFVLLKEAYSVSKSLFDHNKPSWFGSIRKLLDKLQSFRNMDQSKQTPYSFKKRSSSIIKHYFINMWHQENEQQNNGKLRTYVTFKNNFGREHYLAIVNNFDQRKSITKLCISAHQLNIERGRYTGLPPKLRLCSQCHLKEVEDELHFLLACPKYNNERLQQIESVSKINSNFSLMAPAENLMWILNNESKEVLCLLGKFIFENGKNVCIGNTACL
jgi:hypothetical protein